MGWIYLAESEGSLKPFLPGFEQSPIVKTTDTAKASYCPECMQGILQLGLYGTTCGHWRDVISLMSRSTLYSEDFHARTSALLEMETAWKESEADFLERSLGLHAIYDQVSSSWKTYQPSLFEGWTKLQDPLPSSAMIVAGRCYELPPLGHHTDESDGSVWLTTPTTKNLQRSEAFRIGRLPNPSEAIGGTPNPNWIEWLMGYSQMWTEIDASVMPWYQNKRD